MAVPIDLPLSKVSPSSERNTGVLVDTNDTSRGRAFLTRKNNTYEPHHIKKNPAIEEAARLADNIKSVLAKESVDKAA